MPDNDGESEGIDVGCPDELGESEGCDDGAPEADGLSLGADDGFVVHEERKVKIRLEKRR